MAPSPQENLRGVVDGVYRAESRRVFATLVRLLRDFDLAEEALHEAFTAAVERWDREGRSGQPESLADFHGTFQSDRRPAAARRFDELKLEVGRRWEEVAQANAARADEDIEDDRLRLIFTCCHPAIAPSVQVPLTLREVCGLTTEEIASAFLAAPATIAQRIVRGKAKIRDAGIHAVLPTAADLPERLESVLAVIYLVFNEGYSASSGASLMRTGLSGEAIRLGRLLVELLPDAEAIGLLALMLLQESRQPARCTAEGDLILLEDQDRTLWNSRLIEEGQQLAAKALATRRFGAYTVQAAVAAVHASARTATATDWPQITALYDVLYAINPSPVVELNRAVAVAMRDGPEAGLTLIDAILKRGESEQLPSCSRRAGGFVPPLGTKRRCASRLRAGPALTQQEPERRFLTKRLAEL